MGQAVACSTQLSFTPVVSLAILDYRDGGAEDAPNLLEGTDDGVYACQQSSIHGGASECPIAASVSPTS